MDPHFVKFIILIELFVIGGISWKLLNVIFTQINVDSVTDWLTDQLTPDLNTNDPGGSNNQ